jgi:two-component system, OmpR family, response regulator
MTWRATGQQPRAGRGPLFQGADDLANSVLGDIPVLAWQNARCRWAETAMLVCGFGTPSAHRSTPAASQSTITHLASVLRSLLCGRPNPGCPARHLQKEVAISLEQKMAVRCVHSAETLETRAGILRFRDPIGEDSSVMIDTDIERPATEQDDGPTDPTAPANGSGLRVLLAEGDADNAECLALLLQSYGHQVQVARSGSSALHLAQADPPDVVLLEIRLPGMHGWEVVRQLRAQATEKKPFCIALTSCGTQGDRRRSEEAGIDLHLVKPVAPGYLRNVLRRFQAIIRPAAGMPEENLDSNLSRSPCPAVA